MATGPTTSRNASPTTLPIPEQLFQDLSPESRVVALGAKRGPLFYMLWEGLGLPRRYVTDRRYDTLSEHPRILDIKFKAWNVPGAADTAMIVSTTTFKIADAATGTITNPKKLVQVNDKIFVAARQTGQTAADGTVAVAGEVMKILDVTNADGGVITVQRNIGSSATTANVTAASAAYLLGKLIGAGVPETAGAGDSLQHSLLADYNYCEIFQEPYQAGTIARDVKMVGGDPFLRNKAQALQTMMDRLDYALINGRANLDYVDGVPEYGTQGAIPSIVGDKISVGTYGAYSSTTDLVNGNGLSRVWRIGDVSNLNYAKLMTFFERLYDEGGERKLLIGGGGFMGQMALMNQGFWQKEMTSFGPINLQVPGVMTDFSTEPLRMLTNPHLKGAQRNDFIVLDLDFVRLAVFTGGELKEWRGSQGGFGLQDANSRIIKYAWQAIVGLDLTYARAHAYGFGMQNDDGTYGGLVETVGTTTPSNT